VVQGADPVTLFLTPANRPRPAGRRFVHALALHRLPRPGEDTGYLPDACNRLSLHDACRR
jgi:hypothetical protein